MKPSKKNLHWKYQRNEKQWLSDELIRHHFWKKRNRFSVSLYNIIIWFIRHLFQYFRGRHGEKDWTKIHKSRTQKKSSQFSRINSPVEHYSRVFASIWWNKTNQKGGHWCWDARNGPKIIFIFRCIFSVFKWTNIFWEWTTLYNRCFKNYFRDSGSYKLLPMDSMEVKHN